MSTEIKYFDEKMLKTIEVVKSNFAAVRAGRANPAVLDKLTIEYYGNQDLEAICEALKKIKN